MSGRKPGTKKAVLNVTVDEPVAELVRSIAAHNGETISSVVEAALADYLDWERTRLDGIAAIEEYYDEHGWPSAEVEAQAQAEVDSMLRDLEEAHRRNAERREAKRRERRQIPSVSESRTGDSSTHDNSSSTHDSGVPQSGAVA